MGKNNGIEGIIKEIDRDEVEGIKESELGEEEKEVLEKIENELSLQVERKRKEEKDEVPDPHVHVEINLDKQDILVVLWIISLIAIYLILS